MEWIFEYTEYWYDCNTNYEEQTLNITANTKEEAITKGNDLIKKMDEDDNQFTTDPIYRPFVKRKHYRTVKEEKHVFNSSIEFGSEPCILDNEYN